MLGCCLWTQDVWEDALWKAISSNCLQACDIESHLIHKVRQDLQNPVLNFIFNR